MALFFDDLFLGEFLRDKAISSMVETRRAPRFKVLKPARIGIARDAARGLVRDLSVTGAALELELPTDAPEKFTLVIPEDNLSLPCRVVWRRGYKAGVEFEDAADEKAGALDNHPNDERDRN